MIKDVITQLFGNYVPISYTNADGVLVIPDGIAGVDIVWLFGGVLFAITLVCTFKLVGGILKHD